MDTTSANIAEPGSDFTERFAELLRIVDISSPANTSALVPAAGDRNRLTCSSFPAGKDVELVLVRAQRGNDGKALAIRETLTYRPDVAGTDLVYDLTGAFMQGKARPFECDLRKKSARLYALLPFQIESVAVTVLEVVKPTAGQGRGVRFQVEFLDGLGRRAAGALPCQVELHKPHGDVFWRRCLASSKEGDLSAAIELPQDAPSGKWSLVVRSQLDGKQVVLPVNIA